MHVFSATANDRDAVLDLLNHARRSFAAFGAEDLAGLLAQGDCLLAATDNGIACGFLCLTPNLTRWAILRGLALRDSWHSGVLLDAVLPPALAHLRSEGIEHVAVYATTPWLLPVLPRAGFVHHEWIVTLERSTQSAAEPPSVALRAVQPHDLPALVALDAAAFSAPYQLTRSELIELMMTSGYFAVAENPFSGLIGYVCADAAGAAAQVIRLAVHPAVQRRGMGEALLQHALHYCRVTGAERVSINTQESNLTSLRLYERSGFRRIGRRVPLLVRDV